MTPLALARAFSRRMARVAVLAALTMAVVPPVLFAWVSHAGLRAQAEAHARGLARPISRLASQQPQLWRYNVPKLWQATASHRELDDMGAARVTDCAGHTLLDGAKVGLGTGAPSGPAGYAPIEVRNRIIGWVEVTSDATGSRETLRLLATGAILIAGVLGFWLHRLPTRAVYAQAEALRDLLTALADARAALEAANAALQQRVDEAIADVRQLSERVVRTQEDERQRIARDLHDGLGQRMTALQIVLQRAEQSPHTTPDRLREAQELAAGILSEIRRVVRDLRPLELASAGLAAALAELCERFEMRTGLATTFRHRGPDVSNESISLCVWRIAQEALTNVSRHAQASEVGLALTVQAQALELDIWDDGCGLPDEPSASGTGLQGMRERATFLGGRFEALSTPGHGTRLRVTIPLHST